MFLSRKCMPLHCTIALLLTAGALYSQEGDRIDIDKVDPARLLLDKYSFMAQPHSFYYFHNMDQLNLRQDWVHKEGRTFPLKEPKGSFAPTYTFRGDQHTFDEYFARNFVLGFLILTTTRSCWKNTFTAQTKIRGFSRIPWGSRSCPC